MIEEFEKLSPEERDFMLKVPVIITVLVAGSDNYIDKAEIDEGILLAKYKATRSRQDLLDYYKIVGENFPQKIQDTINMLPKDGKERNKILSTELERLNVILPKLDKQFSVQYYTSIKNIAKRVAEASGGIFGYGSISPEELKYANLRMIKNPE
jgi:uncharacterized protein YicC (UPF0701 family)